VLYYVIKIISSAVIITAISEISKRSTLLGSILASIPLISVLGIIWMYVDTKDTLKIAELSTNIFWLVLPSLIFFLVFPILLKKEINFYLALSLSLSLMIGGYYLMVLILKKFGIII